MTTQPTSFQPRPLCAAFAAAAGLSLLAAPSVLAQDAPANPWKSSAALGLTLTQGNTETLLGTANILSGRSWGKNEISLGADATYGKDHSVKNAEAFRGFAQYNWLFQERFFGYLRADALHDAIADVEYRVTLSPGVGYYFIKNDTMSLRGEAGPAFVLEKLGSKTHDYLTLRLAERFDWKITATSTLWQSAEVLPQVDRFQNFLINAELGLETALTEKLSLRNVLQDTYKSEPAPNRKKNDVKLVTQIAYKF